MRNQTRKNQIYRFICHRVKETNGRFPTHREIKDAVGLTTTSVVGPILQALAQDGLLTCYRVESQRHYALAGQCVLLPGYAVQAAAEWTAQGEMTP